MCTSRISRRCAPIAGRIQTSSFVSGQMNYRIALDDGCQILVKEAANCPERPIGEAVGVSWAANDVVILESSGMMP